MNLPNLDAHSRHHPVVAPAHRWHGGPKPTKASRSGTTFQGAWWRPDSSREMPTDGAKFGSRNATRVVAPRKIIPEEYIPMNGEHENSAGKSRSEEKIAERNASER